MTPVKFTDSNGNTFYVNPDMVQVVAPMIDEEGEEVGARLFFSADHALAVSDGVTQAATRLAG